MSETKKIEVDIGAAFAALQASPKLCAAMNELVGGPQLVAAQAEVERLRDLVDSVEQILTECENDFHRCDRCDHHDDNATKESDLFLLLRAALKEQGGSGRSSEPLSSNHSKEEC